jgi:hypothetical protein
LQPTLSLTQGSPSPPRMPQDTNTTHMMMGEHVERFWPNLAYLAYNSNFSLLRRPNATAAARNRRQMHLNYLQQQLKEGLDFAALFKSSLYSVGRAGVANHNPDATCPPTTNLFKLYFSTTVNTSGCWTRLTNFNVPSISMLNRMHAPFCPSSRPVTQMGSPGGAWLLSGRRPDR